MADLLKTGAVWLAGKLKSHASQSISYRKCNQTAALTLLASPVRRDLEVVTNSTVVDNIQLWDFIITAADLTFGGVVVRPEKGDKIIWTDGGYDHVHEISPAPNGFLWDFADSHHVTIAIHTKRTNSGRC